MKILKIFFVFIFTCWCVSVSAQQKVTLPDGIPRNIIIIVGNGMGIGHLTSAAFKNNDTLTLERFKSVGLMKTWSADQVVSDPFASITAVATGKRTKNGAIGVLPDNKPAKNLFEWAKEKGMSTGIVTTNSITRTSLLPFITHSPDIQDDERIALLLTETETDVFISGGKKYFTGRKDKMDLFKTFYAKNYLIEDNQKKVGKIRGNKILALVAEDELPGGSYRKEFLPKASSNAVKLLIPNSKGYFLVIENSHINSAVKVNAPNAIADEVIDLDNAVNEVLKVAGLNTLVIVLGNVESGGITVNGGALKDNKLNTNISNNTMTAAMVPVFAYGPGAENFSGIYNNSDLFSKLLEFVNVRR